MEQRDIAELFLTGFINSIVHVNRKISEIGRFKVPGEQEIQNYRKEKTIIKMIPARIKNIQINQQRTQVVETDYFQRLSNLSQQTQDQRKIGLQDASIKQMSAEEKLNILVRDPAVIEIECTGSDESLLVKKGGVVQKTRIKLSIEEIYQLIAEFSQKTKIPVIDGTLKTAVGNLILTAVLSEILGPKFILQKKNPFKSGDFS